MNIKYRRDLWQVCPPEGAAAEIGVAEGNFAEEMLRWPVSWRHIYLVDRWQCVSTQKGDAANTQEWHTRNYLQVQARVAKYGPRAVILRGDSVEMAARVPDYTLAFVNIDADHSYGGVWADIQAWWPKLMPGGVMAFHDYENPSYGVKAAVQAFLKNIDYPLHLLPEDRMEDAGAYIQLPLVTSYADSI